MIIVQLTGGLGNQLFQYAFGLSLSKPYNEKLYFDISSYAWDTLRTFTLNHFQTHVEVADKNQIEYIKKLSPFLLDRFKYKFQRTNLPYYRLPLLKEQSFAFDQHFEQFRRKNVYVEGYWQTEAYFKNYRKEILHALVVPETKLTSEALRYKTLIQNTQQSISIHIRRGDYVSNPETTAFHGICDANYYALAIKYMESILESPTFFVFSDDKAYIQEIFGHQNNFILVTDIPFDFEELILMSLCEHNIIANSSYSWWGAWLNQHESKKVIAPKRWFANDAMQQLTADLLPTTWIKI